MPESLHPDVSRNSEDTSHREDGRDVYRAENRIVRNIGRHKHVDIEGENPSWLPLGERKIPQEHTSDENQNASRSDLDSTQLDGARDNGKPRRGHLESDENEVVDHQQCTQEILTSEEPSAGLRQPDPSTHPTGAAYPHQELIKLITERLKAEGFTPDVIADLLARGAHLLPRPPPDPGVVAQATPTAAPDLLATAATGTGPAAGTQISNRPSTLDTAAFPTLSLGANAGANRSPLKKMSPGILIPRNAGIKLRGVELEPPLVNAPAPDRSKIVVASQYLFQHDLEAAGMMDERDVQGRLQGIQVIEAGRRGLRMWAHPSLTVECEQY
jgi:hypothetical protein